MTDFHAGVALLLLTLFALPAGLSAEEASQDPAPRKALVNNVWVDVPLSQVLRDISMQIGVTIALDPSVVDQLISLEAEHMPLDECLQKVSAGQGLTVRKIEDKFYVVGTGKPRSPTFDLLADGQKLNLKYISTRDLKKCLPPDLRDYVSYGERTTEAVAYAPPDKMKRILNLIRQIDLPRRQVVLEALVVEISRESAEELGMDWDRFGSDTVVGLHDSTGTFTGTLQYTSIAAREFRTFMVSLRMLVSNGQAKIRSRPRVATLNGEQAAIDVSLEEFYNIVTDVNGTVLRTELQTVKSGVCLKMTPQVGDDGDITVRVTTEVSDVVDRRNNVTRTGGMVDTLPVIRRRKAETKVRVKKGDAIVIGGLVESQEREEVRRVPVLGYIPLLGLLFRTTKSSTVEKEVVIFIRPQLMVEGRAALSDSHKTLNVEGELQQLRRKLTSAAEQAGESPQDADGTP